MVTGKPARQLRVAILQPHGVDLLDVGMIDGEFHLQAVRALGVNRLAIAVVGLAQWLGPPPEGAW